MSISLPAPGASPRYPAASGERDRFILERRGPRPAHDSWRHQGVLVEDERTADGRIVRVATVFLTGRECAWRCAMCDLWRYTTVADTPAGSIPAQIRAARAELGGQPVQCLKLYNASSFFDPRAVPECDYDAIADALRGLRHVVVESHPSLIGARTHRLIDALGAYCDAGERPPALEVAMGLETAHPAALEALHKGITVESFARAADRLRVMGAALRVFVLVQPPFVPAPEQDRWLGESIASAFSCGASVVSLVPTRGGNGTMEALQSAGRFRAPDLRDIERAVRVAHATDRPHGRILVDLWDLERFETCPVCREPRRQRLHRINLLQRLEPDVTCGACGLA